MANQKSPSDIVEKLFKIEMSLKIITNRRDGGPTENEVMETLNAKVRGKLLPHVATVDKPILQGKDWACISMNGKIEER
jgi:hypothetical protein